MKESGIYSHKNIFLVDLDAIIGQPMGGNKLCVVYYMYKKLISDGKGKPYAPTLPILPDEILNKIARHEAPLIGSLKDNARETLNSWGKNSLPFQERTKDLKLSFYGRWGTTNPGRRIFKPPIYSKSDLGKKRRVSEVRRKLAHLKLK